MLICLDCGAEFELPARYSEAANDPPLPFSEWYGCPHCGGEYTERHECTFCCEPIREDHIQLKDGSYVCPDCYNNISVH